MDRILEQSLLYDFYGEMLTTHQKEIYEDFVLDDLSLAEIAEVHGISRQGVHDIVRRTNRQLAGYEEKLHLVERFLDTKEKVEEIRKTARKISEEAEDMDREKLLARVKKIDTISGDILKEL
ncbi:MAG: YlxM family DNA-binding protein [Clostridiales bacterium]|nr:YlxM family DNA-binding protein [Clostridiales bacterium]